MSEYAKRFKKLSVSSYIEKWENFVQKRRLKMWIKTIWQEDDHVYESRPVSDLGRIQALFIKTARMTPEMVQRLSKLCTWLPREDPHLLFNRLDGLLSKQ